LQSQQSETKLNANGKVIFLEGIEQEDKRWEPERKGNKLPNTHIFTAKNNDSFLLL
jgi:hypothetical protein